MSTNTLETAYANGEIIDASHVNELTLALLGSFVGRNASGIPSVGQSLGTLAIPWGNMYATGIVLDGVALDTSTITSVPNRVISGKTRSLSTMADFLRPNGAALSFQVLGATTNLVMAINNTATTVSTDITKSSFTAAPSSQNTCVVNDSTISSDKYVGEDGTYITIGTVGTEISSRIGQTCAFKVGTSEIFLAYIESATKLSNIYRGFMYDSSGNPIVREAISNAATITLLSTGWVFIEDNGTTVDVTYKTPVISYASPSSPATGDYWLDITNQTWKRYSGTTFEVIDRTLVGVVAANTTACIGSRSFEYYRAHESFNNLEVEKFSNEIIVKKGVSSQVTVNGAKLIFDYTFPTWNITTDLESPQTEAASTTYWLYLTDKGQRVISNEKPYNRADLKGYYHPFHTWRAIGEVFNNASSNLDWLVNFKYMPQKYRNDTSEYRAHTHNGYGATSTVIPRFTTAVKTTNNGAVVDVVDNSNTGTTITCKRKCKIYASVSSGTVNSSGEAGSCGFSLNSTQLTTGIESITAADRLGSMSNGNNGTATQAGTKVGCTFIGEFNKGDVIRPHGIASTQTTTTHAILSIYAEALD